jgi:FMN-dependent NADH-azoreductase
MPNSSHSARLLHLDSSVLGDHSVSRRLSARLVEQWRSADPAIVVTYRDLKARIDRILQPGRTFRYTPGGPVGLADGNLVNFFTPAHAGAGA